MKKVVNRIRSEIPKITSVANQCELQEGEILQIVCNPAVSHEDINEYVNHCKTEGCTICRRLMQTVRLLVTEANESCRKNFEITCYGRHFALRFSSGSQGNKIVVQVLENKIHVTLTKTSWQQWFKEIFQRNWKTFLGIFVTILAASVGAFVPPALPAMVGMVVGLSLSDLLISHAVPIACDQVYQLTE